MYSSHGRFYQKHLYIACLFLLGVRIKKPVSKNLMNYNQLKKDFPKHVRIFLLVTQQWIPGVVSVSVCSVAVRTVVCVCWCEGEPKLQSSDKQKSRPFCWAFFLKASWTFPYRSLQLLWKQASKRLTGIENFSCTAQIFIRSSRDWLDSASCKKGNEFSACPSFLGAHCPGLTLLRCLFCLFCHPISTIW